MSVSTVRRRAESHFAHVSYRTLQTRKRLCNCEHYLTLFTGISGRALPLGAFLLIQVPALVFLSCSGCTHYCRKHEEQTVATFHQYKDPWSRFSRGRQVL
jgi:hypothetical protein